MQAANDDRVRISAGGMVAEIEPFGAELAILRDRDGRDLLYDGDPRYWTGRAPLLFPVVGALAGGAYRLGRQEWRMPQHGFARRCRFSVTFREADSVGLRLRENALSREMYPFPFQLDVVYRVAGDALEVEALVTNRGRRPMPAAFGFHPAFRWPLPYGGAREEHALVFEFPEPGPLRRPDASGLLLPPLRRSPVGPDGRLPLSDSLFDEGALVFCAARSRRVLYGAPGRPHIAVTFPEMPDLGVWSKPRAQAPFVCIEPWHGYADAAPLPGDPARPGDLYEKPGMVELPPGASRAFAMRIALVEG
ncbi:aldose 1-epimerase family protein [Camelimonas abortus]|uniref:Aldose 1-epimerase family protein n=1 Tax=Camelimonas abortus TaxID=1017184 RepID=A0ABV7LFZ6_9HYPH